jgi:alpha-mannosidase
MLDAFCDTVSAQSAYPYNVAGAFGYGHDDLDTYLSQPFIDAARTATTPTRRVRVSNEEDFFRDAARTYPQLPAESVSYGNEWDLYCASMNETTARVRRATEKLRAAEALAAVAALRAPTFAQALTPARDLAWEGFGMYWEHNWTGDGPVKQPVRAQWQEKIQGHISSYVDSLHALAGRTLGSQLRRGAAPRYYVFNPLSWVRADVADLAYAGPYPVRVVDLTTQQEVPSQQITKAGQSFLRIYAEGLPSVGYKVYELQPGAAAPAPVAATLTGEYLSNAHYRLRLSLAGAITELYDRAAGNRQLVQPVAGRYLNDLGGPVPATGRPLELENAGPVSVTVKAVAAAPVPHVVRITLYAHSPRIDIEDSIQANFTDVKTWAFSFNLDKPTTHHEELGAILTAKKETRGGHYAAQNARLDWLTFNHFADLSESAYGVTLSNVDCSFFKLGQSTVDSLWEQSPQLLALAGGQVDRKVEDGGALGIYGQNGQTQFRYAFSLTTHLAAFDPLAALKFSLEHQNPLVTGAVTGTRDLHPSPSFSLLSTDDPSVLLWSLKPSEDGLKAGLIARLWNVNAHAARPTLRGARPLRRVWQTTHLETNERQLSPAAGLLRVRLAPQQLATYRLQF